MFDRNWLHQVPSIGGHIQCLIAVFFSRVLSETVEINCVPIHATLCPPSESTYQMMPSQLVRVHPVPLTASSILFKRERDTVGLTLSLQTFSLTIMNLINRKLK